MATDQVRIKSLYAGLYRTVIRLGLLIAAAWLFALFSYYLSSKTGSDWLARSGSVMGLVGAAVTFRLANFYQRPLATAKPDLTFKGSSGHVGTRIGLARSRTLASPLLD